MSTGSVDSLSDATFGKELANAGVESWARGGVPRWQKDTVRAYPQCLVGKGTRFAFRHPLQAHAD